MKKHSKDNQDELTKLIGLGNLSARKTYYPQLIKKLDELEVEKNRYKWLFENALHGIVHAELDGKLLQVNPAFARICGYADKSAALSKVKNITAQLFYFPHEYQEFKRRLLKEKRIEGFQACLRKFPKEPIVVSINALLKPMEGKGFTFEAFLQDITLQKKYEEEVHRLAFYDSLTGLPNRRTLIKKIDTAIKQAKENGQMGALLFIDLDNFKNLNDTRGHTIGDAMLKEVANRLSDSVLDCQSVYRIGGDDFIVMLEGLGSNKKQVLDKATIVAKKIQSTFEKAFSIHEVNFRSSCSIGITPFDGEDLGDDVMTRSDMAMYQAKWSGKNTFKFFDTGELAPQFNLAELEVELRNALTQNQFKLYYQAQYCSKKLCGAEVLLRWVHPERGVISPMQFIPLAEETGLMSSIGHWVIEQACHQLGKWAADEKTASLKLAVNVSARQFSDVDFVSNIRKVLRREKVPPKKLKLEITESLLLVDIDSAIEKIEQLHAMGVRFSLDDFGTGYSSLMNLKRLHLDQIKIDRTFVKDILEDKSNSQIVQTIIALASNLGLNVIAEGVENEPQRELLTSLGCSDFQGFLFGKPIPLDRFESEHVHIK